MRDQKISAYNEYDRNSITYKESRTPYPPMKHACAEQSNHDPVF